MDRKRFFLIRASFVQKEGIKTESVKLLIISALALCFGL